MLVALSGHGPDHARWAICSQQLASSTSVRDSSVWHGVQKLGPIRLS